jgi:hypothetical protein
MPRKDSGRAIREWVTFIGRALLNADNDVVCQINVEKPYTSRKPSGLGFSNLLIGSIFMLWPSVCIEPWAIMAL